MNVMSYPLTITLMLTVPLGGAGLLMYEYADQPGKHISLFDEQCRRVRLEQQVERTKQRLAIKDQATTRLLAGDLTLVEVAACFRSLYDVPGTWPNPSAPCPGPDEGEKWCRLVITWVELKVSSEQSPSQAGTVRERLEAELQRHLERHGTVELPE